MIKVVDSIMGSGKTSWAIRYMNDNPQRRFIYVTPFQKEIERVIAACPELSFKQPTDEISKTASVHRLLADGQNICMTHELFSMLHLSQSEFEQVLGYEYHLILDEVLEVVVPVKISKSDVEMLFDTHKMEADENGAIQWTDTEYQGEFASIKNHAQNHTQIWFQGTVLIWVFPKDILYAFPNVTVLTFLFHGSNMMHFMRANSIQYHMYHIQEGMLVEGQQDLKTEKKHLSSLISVVEGKLNTIGEDETALSKGFYAKHSRDGTLRELSKNTYNHFYNNLHAKAKDCLWSMYADARKKFGVRDYATAFCSCNARATNEFRERHHLAYLLNVYVNPLIVNYFAEQGEEVNQEAFALSQLLQWIWRSAIREGEPITLYLPSARMRRLLYDWLSS